MPCEIFKRDCADAIQSLVAKGYVSCGNAEPTDRREFEGRMWMKEGVYSNKVEGWDRFVLFLKTLFQKLAVALTIISNDDEVKGVEREWKRALSGGKIKTIFKDILEEMGARVTEAACPEGEDSSEYTSATILPVENGFVFRFPRTQNEVMANFTQLLGDNCIPFEERNIRFENFTKEYFIGNDHMAAFLGHLPNLNLGIGTEALAQDLFQQLGAVTFTHFSSDANGRPRYENSIELTLAHLDREMDRALRVPAVRMNSTPEDHLSVPLVTFDDFGLTIKVSQPHLGERIAETYCLRMTQRAEMIGDREYVREFRIPREEIGQFVKALGLEFLPADMHPDYADGEYQFMRGLILSGKVFLYNPTHRNSAFESIAVSLQDVVENIQAIERENGEFDFSKAAPYVAMHPKGWLAIRIPGGTSEEYVNKLKNFLGIAQDHLIAFTDHNGVSYDKEIIVDGQNIYDFLKKMRLEEDADGNDLEEKLLAEDEQRGQYVAVQPTNVTREGLEDAVINSSVMFDTESRERLAQGLALEPLAKPAIFVGPAGMTVRIPQVLNERIVEVAGQEMGYGQYLAHIYGISGRPAGHGYQFEIPKDALQVLFERDLCLRELPEALRTANMPTFFRKFAVEHDELGFQFGPFGSMRGWNLRNPALPIPANVPNLSNQQIVDAARRILERHGPAGRATFSAHPRRDQFCRVIEETLRGVHHLSGEAGNLLSIHLKLIVRPPANSGVTLARQRAALIAIGETATGCMPGRQTKISFEYQTLFVPALRDRVRTVLLHEVEAFKMNLLADIFRDLEQSVHAVAAAQAFWGEEFGLDQEAGRRDAYHDGYYGRHQLTQERKDRFVTGCQETLATTLVVMLSQNIYREGEVETNRLVNEDLYRERIIDILRRRGFSSEEIEGNGDIDDNGIPVGGEIDRLLPRDERGNITLTLRAVQMMLIDIGVLHG